MPNFDSTMLRIMALDIRTVSITIRKCDTLGPLVWFFIFMQRHQVDFLGNLSGKTKQSVTFEI
jgi:hypothetical protein